MDNSKELAVLKTSFQMYEDTKKKTEKNMKMALTKDKRKLYSEEDIEKELKSREFFS